MLADFTTVVNFILIESLTFHEIIWKTKLIKILAHTSNSTEASPFYKNDDEVMDHITSVSQPTIM